MIAKLLVNKGNNNLETLCLLDAEYLPDFTGVCFEGGNYEVTNKLLVLKRQDDKQLTYSMSYILEKM